MSRNLQQGRLHWLIWAAMMVQAQSEMRGGAKVRDVRREPVMLHLHKHLKHRAFLLSTAETLREEFAAGHALSRPLSLIT